MTESDLDFTTAVAAALRAERAAQSITLEQLAERSGIPVVSVQRYLAGKRDLRMSTVKVLAEAMGSTAGEIVTAAEFRYERAVASTDIQIEAPGEDLP